MKDRWKKAAQAKRGCKGAFALGRSFRLACCAWALSQTALAGTALTQHLNTLLARYPEVRIGIAVQALKPDKLLFQKNIRQRFTPASILKIATATEALKLLGPHFHYQTAFYLQPTQLQKHMLRGPLTLRFSGDPSLNDDDLSQLVAQLKHPGIRRIQGNILLDTHTFDAIPYPPGRIWDDLSYAYGAPIQSATLDGNQWKLHITPNNRLQQPAILRPDMPFSQLSLINHTTTSSGWRKHCPVAIYHLNHQNMLLRGCLPRFIKPQFRMLALYNTLPMIQHDLRAALKTQNIAWSGSFSVVHPAHPGRIFAVHESAPLTQLLRRLLKQSDNLYADTLLKTFDANRGTEPAHWDQSLRAATKSLAGMGVRTKPLLITDGSGLSRYNLVSPEMIINVLRYAYRTPTVGKSLMPALAEPGKKGTLRWRSTLKNMHMHAKTGSMAGVLALAGFMRNKKNQPLAFVIMVNAFVGTNKRYRIMEDRICQNLRQWS